MQENLSRTADNVLQQPSSSNFTSSMPSPMTMRTRTSPEMMIWLMWSCAALFYFYQFILRVSPGVMAEELKADFMVGAAALGTLTSYYYWAYASLQIPVGVLMDRFGPKLLIVAAALICSGGCIIFASVQSVYIASLGRLLMGVGSACGFLGCVKLGSLWLRPERMTILVGMTMLIGTSGAVGGGMPLAHAVHSFGWRNSIFLLAGLGVLIGILVLSFVKDRREPLYPHTTEDGNIAPPQNYGFLTSLVAVIKKPQSWLIGVYGGLMYIPLSAFADLWGPSFVAEAWGIDIKMAAGVVSTFYIGVGLGGPLNAWVSDYYKSHRLPLFISSISTTLIMLGLIEFPQYIPFNMVSILCILAGLSASGQFLCFVSVSELNPGFATATANGFHNMLCMISGVVFQPVVGKLMEYNASVTGHTPGQAFVHTLQDYQFALMSIPLCMLVAFILAFGIKETCSKEKQSR